MSLDAWVIIGGMLLAGAAGSFWWARQYDRTAATYQRQVDTASELHRRSLALLDRQEQFLERAEALMERLEKRHEGG